MSECVVRMEMPGRCLDCPCLDDYGDYPRCRISNEQRGYNFPIHEKRMPGCPITQLLPDGHGRLVDADAFEKDVSDALVYGLKEITSEEGKQIFHVMMQEVLDNIKKRETIVPAEAERSET